MQQMTCHNSFSQVKLKCGSMALHITYCICTAKQVMRKLPGIVAVTKNCENAISSLFGLYKEMFKLHYKISSFIPVPLMHARSHTIICRLLRHIQNP